VQQKPLPSEHSIRIAQNFGFFDERVAAIGNDLDELCQGLSKLVIVDVALNSDQDNPQLIFETMNSTGRELSQADLICNFILMGLEPKHQTLLYEDFWRPMEVKFGQEACGSHFDRFMRHYLTLKTGEIPNVRAVYEAFKQFARQPAVSEAGVDDLVKDINAFAGHYCAMAFGKESAKALSDAFQDLRELKGDVVPQASRLRLSLNLPFHELHDPRGMAKDVTALSRWGDVEVGITATEDLPYVMGLVRQSFERQMGNGSHLE